MKRLAKPTLLLILPFLIACGSSQDKANGPETELAGDEADETNLDYTEPTGLNPADTVVNMSVTEVNDRLREHAQVLVSTYLEMGEALVQEDIATAKSRAEQVREILERHEQENLDLEQEVKVFYTEAAHIIREGAQNALLADQSQPVRTAYAAMAPAAYRLARIADFDGETLFYHFCPEALDGEGAYWLSRSEEVKNPYLTSQEQKSCGKLVTRL